MSITQEISVFLAACCTGVVVSSVYGALRILRRLFKHSLFWVSVEDLIYWLWFAIYIFLELHRTCSGRIRWYFLVGVGLGIWSSAAIICKFIKKRIDKSKETR